MTYLASVERVYEFQTLRELKGMVVANGDCLTVQAGDLVHAVGFQRTRSGPWETMKKKLGQEGMEVYPEELAVWRAEEEVRVYVQHSLPAQIKATVLQPSKEGDRRLTSAPSSTEVVDPGPDLEFVKELLKDVLKELGD